MNKTAYAERIYFAVFGATLAQERESKPDLSYDAMIERAHTAGITAAVEAVKQDGQTRLPAYLKRFLWERMMDGDPRQERLRSLAQLRDGAYQRRRELMNEVRQLDEHLELIIQEMVNIQIS